MTRISRIERSLYMIMHHFLFSSEDAESASRASPNDSVVAGDTAETLASVPSAGDLVGINSP